MGSALKALGSVDFDWTRHLQSVWDDAAYDVAELNGTLAESIIAQILACKEPGARSPLGRIVIGQGGAGKTHLVGKLRKRMWEENGWFVLFDLADVNDFWATAALGYLQSLQQAYSESEGLTQGDEILLRLCAETPTIGQALKSSYPVIFNGKGDDIFQLADAIVDALRTPYRKETQRHRNVIRAFVTLQAHDPEVSDMAYSWLQGVTTEDSPFGPTVGARDVIRGLSWLMSLCGPTLLVVDQIDAIVGAHRHALEAGEAANGGQDLKALAIIDGLAGGLMDLRDITSRTITVLSSLETTWEILEQRAHAPAMARFKPPDYVRPIADGSMAQNMVAGRLAPAYERHGYAPQYPSWPFHPDAFKATVGWLPRELLRRCDAHIQHCLTNNSVSELTAFDGAGPEPAPPPPTDAIEAKFNELREKASIDDFRDPSKGANLLSAVLLDALRCYVLQSELPDDVDLLVEDDPRKRRPALHARLRRVFLNEGGREVHHCFRAIPHSNAIAFQARLRAAMTAAGIDLALPFRHLFIIRRDPPPSGPKTRQMCEDFKKAGGTFVQLGKDGLRTMLALRSLYLKPPDGFEAWLKQRRPLCDISLFKEAGLCGDTVCEQPAERSEQPRDSGKPDPKPATAPPPSGRQPEQPAAPQPREPEPPTPTPTPSARTEIPVGRRLVAGVPEQPRSLALGLLPRHTAILAGSGSGKTVLLRRIIEEAALLGVPAIVLDTNNDLARLGDPWPEQPPQWQDEDAEKARSYGHEVEAVVWTPGLMGGNPVVLAPIPDFEAVRGDADELRQTIVMAHATLTPLVGATGQKGVLKEGVLMHALQHFARGGHDGLDGLVRLLSDLPHEVSDIDKADALANDMANQIRAAIAKNPLLGDVGTPLDPHTLFTSPTGRTRISVINFSGLPADEAKQSFVNQLQMTLFSWVKKNPAPVGRPLTGLLVMDEAQNFAPSQKNTPCKESTVGLVAQARKYGLGMIFATQVPKGIDNKIVSNCTTHFYGRMSAPATIQAIQELMASRGGRGDDIGTLKAGQFYYSTEGVEAPEKLQTPLCLSHHPQNPLSQEDVVDRARLHRAAATGEAA